MSATTLKEAPTASTLEQQLANDRDESLFAALRLFEGSKHRLRTSAEETELRGVLFEAQDAEQQRKMLSKIRVRERDIYERGREHSYFRDLVATNLYAQGLSYNLDTAGAQHRLQRHQAFERTRQRRDLSTSAGSGGEFVPPKWITEEWVGVVRSASPLRRLIGALPLPPGTMSIDIPRFDNESGPQPQTYQNTNVAAGIDSATDSVSSAVETFGSSIPASRIWLDQGPAVLDEIITRELATLYAAELEAELIAGPGGAGRILGALNVSTTPVSPGIPGAVATTYTDASPTPAKALQAIAQLIAVQGSTRRRMPTVTLARPERVAWLLGALDGDSSDPTMRPGTGFLDPTAPIDGPFGPVPPGLALYASSAVPNDLGVGANEDAVLSLHLPDVLLYEDAPTFVVMPDTRNAAASMTLQFVAHAYAAAMLNRQPSCVGFVTGTGFILPAGWSA
jgi:HK97 family phage major capsid protein